jgi:hypothetical protein
MTVSAVVLGLVVFQVMFRYGASYSFNIDNDVDSSAKVTYPSSESTFATSVDVNQDFNGDGFNDILANAYNGDTAYLFLGANTDLMI